MRAPETVAPGHVVSIHYTLTLDDGTEADTSFGADPLVYLHGHGNIVPGLEDGLLGRAVGDRLVVTVAPDKGYGELQEDANLTVSRGAFPQDLDLEEGLELGVEGSDGEMIPMWVERVDGDEVELTANHPLAGRTLTFAVEVVGVRSATAEEIAHGHPHGPGGHEH
jgi:FKBP-type peptidyl-prolyl cis-trans isomerase SlyD